MTNHLQRLNRNELEAAIRSLKLVAFDFDGVFTDNMVYVSQDGTEMVRCSRGDGLGLHKLRRLGIEMVIISTETNPVVMARSKKLKLPCYQGINDKRAAMDKILEEKGLTPNQVAFVGNDINDLPCLAYVGLAVIVQDAHPDVLPYAHYQTNNLGGNGAVREFCDLVADILDTE
ncbi:MAG: HAD hydrolase family protein [Chloroflexota bacterium]